MKFYITTTLPYVNADPHIGFALEITQADAIARYRASKGDDVFFNTGTDEHGMKIYQKAIEAKKDPQEYVDEYALRFDKLKHALNLSYNAFIRTTDEHHIKAAQEFWKICDQNGDIYKKNYKIKYCVGCELEKTDSDLAQGRCLLHPDKDIETIEEENYFFRFSKYQPKLLKLYKDNPDFVVPKWRLKEITNFVETGLEDFSISRLKEKMPWGIQVPSDNDHVMYVWFDALINYVSTIGWPSSASPFANLSSEALRSSVLRAKDGRRRTEGKPALFDEWWPVVQIAGKDNLRQQAAMWQAMLMSAGIKPSKQILIHGFITSMGQKMSKSQGNVVNPFDLVEKYGTDALRYYLLAEIPSFEDGDFTIEKFEQRYNGDLANGLGNLVSRVSNLIEKAGYELSLEQGNDMKLKECFDKAIERYEFNQALDILWSKLRSADASIAAQRPWELSGDAQRRVLEPMAQDILNVADLLEPFLPETAQKIIKQFSEKKIKKQDSLFPRV